MRKKETEEREERPKRRRRRKRKRSRFGYYLYAVVSLILTTVNIMLATLLLTHVQKVEISGNKYSRTEDITEWVEEDPYTSNSIYAFVKFKSGSYSLPVYLEQADMKAGLPWVLKIKVKEKPVIGGILLNKQYVYFDKEGLVLIKGKEMLEEVPIIEGIEVKSAEQYKKLPVKDKKIFSYIIGIRKEIQKNGLKPDRIVWESEGMDLYFEGVRVQLGKTEFDEKMKQLPAILEKLEGQKGILHLEHYNQTSTNISFEKSVE